MMKKSKDVAGKNGKSIVGILTDKAIMEKKPKPILSFDERVEIAKSIKYVDKVISQESYSLAKYKYNSTKYFNGE